MKLPVKTGPSRKDPVNGGEYRVLMDSAGAWLADVRYEHAEQIETALNASPGEAEGEWSLSSEPPFVSGWRWIDYWTVDGLPGCKRFMVGDTWMDATIACWRFRGSMPPYAAAPNPSTRSEGKGNG